MLFYGHYDVQPPDPLDEWKSPPFEPEVRGDDIFARGASRRQGPDLHPDQGRRGAAEDHRPAAGQREVPDRGRGGDRRRAHRALRGDASRARLKADAAVICDTEMFAPDLPTICVGLRGIVYGELHVEGANHDLHSGVYGGAAPNPIQAIAEILCALKDRDGHIRIPGFYDRVRAAQPEGARGLGAAAVRREGVHGEGDGRARTDRRAGASRCSSASGRGPRSRCTASAAASPARAPRP